MDNNNKNNNTKPVNAGFRQSGIFCKMRFTHPVKIFPHELGTNLEEIKLVKLRNALEGICSRHGYVRPGSIRIDGPSKGCLGGIALTGDIVYHVPIVAEVCNPCLGHIITSRVAGINKFGVLAWSGIEVNGRFVKVIETIIPRHNYTTSSAPTQQQSQQYKQVTQDSAALSTLRVGDDILLEILNAPLSKGETTIHALGRLITDKNITERAAAALKRGPLLVSSGMNDEDTDSLSSVSDGGVLSEDDFSNNNNIIVRKNRQNQVSEREAVKGRQGRKQGNKQLLHQEYPHNKKIKKGDMLPNARIPPANKKADSDGDEEDNDDDEDEDDDEDRDGVSSDEEEDSDQLEGDRDDEEDDVRTENGQDDDEDEDQEGDQRTERAVDEDDDDEDARSTVTLTNADPDEDEDLGSSMGIGSDDDEDLY